MIPVHSQYTIDVAIFEQSGGWVFIGVPHGEGWYGDVLFSGKRRNLEAAMESAKQLAGPGVPVVYSRIDNTTNDWTF